jgi:hypothetical protein
MVLDCRNMMAQCIIANDRALSKVIG